MSGAFAKQTYDLVAQIPYGRVTTYGRIAALLGRPRAARQVGWAMRVCPETLPWQRVVRADGSIVGGDYAELRRALLTDEGVPFTQDGRVDLTKCLWP